MFFFLNPLLLIFTFELSAQFENKVIEACPRNKLRVLPIAFFRPETHIGVGGLFYYIFRFDKEDTIVKRSNSQTYINITQKHQFSIENQWDIYGKHNSYYFHGELDFAHFPEYFYGIGNYTHENNRELYSFDRIQLISKNLKKVSASSYAGVQIQIQNLYHVNNENVSLMKNGAVLGANGFFVAGLGPIFIRDKRNNILNATRGSYFETHLLTYNYGISNAYRFVTLTADYRKYFTINLKNTFAFQSYLSLNEGDLPFRMMPAIGGARYLRGYYSGRFRDNNLCVLQTEYRRKIAGRFGFALFTGIGEVAHTISDFTEYGIKWNYGMGLRYQINNAEDVNVRLDVGMTSDKTVGLYIIFAEAF